MSESKHHPDKLVKLFFKEMGRFPLLTKEEEQIKLKEVDIAKQRVMNLLIFIPLFRTWQQDNIILFKSNKKLAQISALLSRLHRGAMYDVSIFEDLFSNDFFNLSQFFESKEWEQIQYIHKVQRQHILSLKEERGGHEGLGINFANNEQYKKHIVRSVLHDEFYTDGCIRQYSCLIDAISELHSLVKIF